LVPQALHRTLAFLVLVVWWMSKRDTDRADEHRDRRQSSGGTLHYFDEQLSTFHNLIGFAGTIAVRRYKQMTTSQKNGDVSVAIM
jgi:hypothetical protein